MGESSFDRWANVLVDYSTEVATGDQVAISGGVAAEPLLRAIYRAVLRKGGLPVLLPSFSEAQADLFNLASDEQLAYISPLERWMREEAPVSIDVSASTNTRALSAVDPSRQSVWSRARTELRQRLRACRAGERRWSSTIFPTPAHAQDADMATDEFAAFLEVAACMLDRPDPIAAWREALGAASPHDRLASGAKRDPHHRAGDGPSAQRWRSFLGQLRRKAQFSIRRGLHRTGGGFGRGAHPFHVPGGDTGREVSGIRLRFDAGLVVDASADKNEPFLVETLDTDPGGAPGRVRVRDERRDLAMDKEHPARREDGWHGAHGAWVGLPETGSQNTSAIHWDMICDLRQGGEATADGEVVLRTVNIGSESRRARVRLDRRGFHGGAGGRLDHRLRDGETPGALDGAGAPLPAGRAARPPAGRSVVHRPWGRRGVPVATSRRIDFERRLSFSDPDPLRDVIAIGGSGGGDIAAGRSSYLRSLGETVSGDGRPIASRRLSSR